MTERERLIELLKIPYEVCKNTSCNTCEHKGKYYCFLEKYADSLLAHGVIVPPRDIGDEIYYFIGKEKIYKSVCHAFSRDAWDNLIIIDALDGYHSAERVFLTREEAEAALKEREQI